MKTNIALLVLAMAASTVAHADLVCKTAPQPYNGGIELTVTETDAYDAVIQGTQNGGMATFIREIGPENVKIQHEPDGTFYTNDQDGFELAIITTAFGGRLQTTATFVEGTNARSISMTCHQE